MKIFLSGITTEMVRRYYAINPHDLLNVFLSYGHIDSHNGQLTGKYRHLVNELVLDSGAFSLNKNPFKLIEKISFQGYKDYLQSLSDKYSFFFNFDADFSAKAFQHNIIYQQQLELSGLCPVPVIRHFHEINYYIDNDYLMVGIGSNNLGRSSADSLKRGLQKLFANRIKVHFLGCMEPRKLISMPVYSCDGTTWTQSASMGYILYWNPKKPGINKAEKIDFITNRHNRKYYLQYEWQSDLEKYLSSELNLGIDDLVGKDNILNRQIVNIHYYVKLEKLITERHRQQRFI